MVVYGKEFPDYLFPEHYLLKINNFDDVAKTSLDEWIYFLKNAEIKSSFSAKGLKKPRKNSISSTSQRNSAHTMMLVNVTSQCRKDANELITGTILEVKRVELSAVNTVGILWFYLS